MEEYDKEEGKGNRRKEKRERKGEEKGRMKGKWIREEEGEGRGVEGENIYVRRNMTGRKGQGGKGGEERVERGKGR